MADPATYRPAPGSIPDAPGVYRFRDAGGRVIYVGKAKSLRSRLNSYFADPFGLHQRTRQMVTTAAAVDWITVGTEVEALQQEYTWIKEYDPRFNVRYRDDKSYPYLAVTLDEEFPRLQVMRGAKRKGVRYFGPYSHAWAIRETLDLLLRVFPARTCSKGVFKRAGQIGRPCLLGYIGKCSAPCVGSVTPEEHRRIVEDFCDFMAGKTDTMVRRLEREMHEASDQLEFELAARLRDDIAALRRALEKQTVVLGDGTDADVVAFAEDPLEAAVQVFHVRGGRVRGQRGWVVEKTEDLSTGDLVHHFCTQIYGGEQGETDVPRELLVPECPVDADALTEWMSVHRGSRVTIRVPQRGDKKALLDTVARNAQEALTRHKLKRSADLTTRSQALEEIADALGMDTAPLRIECYDVSQIQGTDVVASMVVFEDGLPRKSEYRRFVVRGATDDLSAISEVLRRRFARYLDVRAETGELGDEMTLDPDRPGIDPTTGRPRKFAYPPQLVVVDGGEPQVRAAAAVLSDLGIDDIALCGLAKRLEEVWVPNDEFPVVMSRTSEGLYLLQRVRDEAHRFAIAFHRQRRSKRMTVSALDDIPGLGDIRRKALMRRFGSVKRLGAASIEEISEVPGVGRRTADAIKAALAGDAASDAGGSGGTADAGGPVTDAPGAGATVDDHLGTAGGGDVRAADAGGPAGRGRVPGTASPEASTADVAEPGPSAADAGGSAPGGIDAPDAGGSAGGDLRAADAGAGAADAGGAVAGGPGAPSAGDRPAET